MPQRAVVQDFFDIHSHTFSYVVFDVSTRQCAIIDSVLGFDQPSASTNTHLADEIIRFIHAENLTVQWILETHVHADHLTAAQYLKEKLGGKIAISKKISDVQESFSQIYDLDLNKANSKQPFDHLFDDYESFNIGELVARNIPTPGHTPACLTYVIGDAVFVGDTIFMPDYGTARCDFPKGSAAELFDSVQKLFELPENYRVYLCHDYLPESRDTFTCETTIKEQKLNNIHINEKTNKVEFIEMREERDARLDVPQLILPSIQVNMNAGKLPDPEENGISYLKLPINFLKKS